MKKLILSILLSAASITYVSAQRQAGPSLGKAFSIFSTALQAADSKDPAIKIALAALWDLLPEGPDIKRTDKNSIQYKDKYDRLAGLYLNKFAQAPSEIDLSTMSQYGAHKQFCEKAAQAAEEQARKLQKNISALTQKATALQNEIRGYTTDLNALRQALQSFSSRTGSLFEAVNAVNAAFASSVPVSHEDLDTLRKDLQARSTDYERTLTELTHTAADLGVDVNLENKAINEIISGLLNQVMYLEPGEETEPTGAEAGSAAGTTPRPVANPFAATL
jgi:hypothetical protein